MNIQYNYKNFIDQFTVESSKITHEFFSPVYISIGTYLNQKVALKQGTNLTKEIEIHKYLCSKESHPNVIKFLAEINHGEDNYILMEGIKDGLTLHTYCSWDLRWYHPLTINKCIDLMLQIARGLKHIHDNGIIHHDLTDNNILVSLGETEDDIILKICDFGLSELTTEGYGNSELREAGTLNWMAPEQFNASNKTTQKMDIYNFSKLCTVILFKGRKSDQVIIDVPIKLMNLIQLFRSNNPDNRPNITEAIKMLKSIDDFRSEWDRIDKLYQQFVNQGIEIPDILQDLYDKYK